MSSNSVNFIKIPNCLVSNEVKATTLKIYAALGRRCYKGQDQTWISTGTITADCGIKSRTTISAATKELKKWGWLKTQRRMNTSNIYNVKKPTKDYTCIEIDALRLSPEPFRLLCYVRGLYIPEDGRKIKIKKITDHLGISRREILLNYLKALSLQGKITTCNFVNSKTKYLQICEQASVKMWTDVSNFVDTNHTALTILLEPSISFENKQSNAKQGNKQNNNNTNNGDVSLGGVELEKVSSRQQKNLNRRQIRKGGGNPVQDKHRFAKLMERFESWKQSDNPEEREKAKTVLRYVAHELRLWDTKNIKDLKQKKDLIRYFKGEALFGEGINNEAAGTKHPIFQHFLNMTPAQRKADKHKSKVYRDKRQTEQELHAPESERTSMLQMWREAS